MGKTDLKLIGFYGTDAEKRAVKDAANGERKTVSAYLREKVFGKRKGKTASRGRPKNPEETE